MTSFVRGLKCRLCGKAYPQEPLNFCTEDFGPLEVDYNYEAISQALRQTKFEGRPKSMWRFRELLPINGAPTVGAQVGGTPLVRADRLALALGVGQLWIKNDAVNFPTLSFKDRVVSTPSISRRSPSRIVSFPSRSARPVSLAFKPLAVRPRAT
jgi:threonine synthase